MDVTNIPCERLPNKSWSQDAIMIWQQGKNIKIDKWSTKTELLDTIKKNSDPYNKYVIDK